MIPCHGMPPSIRHRKDVLANGLRVVTVELPYLHTAALVFYAKVGSRYETPEDNGLSHFLEHMLFRGTQRLPSSYALNLAIEELGGTLYAETGRDYSLYQISLDPELVPKGIELFGDIMRAPAFSQLDLERKIIIEEINEDLDERGRDINIDDMVRRAAFPGHGLGQKITGPLANVEKFALADVKRHFARFYGARNLIFCVSGPVQRGRVLAAAKRHLGGLPAGAPARAAAPPKVNGREARFLYVDVPGAQTAVQLLFRALPETHRDFVALQALGRVLDDGMSTRLHYTLCDQMGLAYYVSSALEPFHDAALFEVDGASAHGKVPELVRQMFALLDRLRDEPVSETELAKAKRRYRFDLGAAFDDCDAMAGWFGGTELFYPPASFEAKVERMERVTVKDVQRAALAVLRPANLIAGASGALTHKQRREVERLVRGWK